ncbi:MAG: FdhF/YdeP family oxidoreductase [Rhodothermales bacterium]
MNESPHHIRAEPPEETTRLDLRPPPERAAGVAAIRSALRIIREEMRLGRGLNILRRVNQREGFDCPGCAWPDPAGRRSSLGEYCENGAKAVASEATEKRIGPDFFAEYSVDDLLGQSDYWHNQQGRLTHPMILREGSRHYEPIAWDDAFTRIAAHLQALDSPDQALFYTSGRTSNEAAFLYQLFGRLFGTNNFPDCSNMCHESSGMALGAVIGSGKGTVTLDDFDVAEVIVVIGQNPGTNHPRMLSALQRAKRNGATILHINPLPEAGLKRFNHPQEVAGWLSRGTMLADQFLQVRINGDVALLKGLMKAMIERHGEAALDRAFIDPKTDGVEGFLEDLRTESWETIGEESGIDRDEIDRAADILARRERIIVCWAMGLTQHKNAIANIQSCVNLLLMRGAFGKLGAGACPVRGHSNVQGDRTMGITPRPAQPFLDALAARYGFEPPRRPGLDTVDAIQAMHAGRAHVFFALGGNFLSATPDTAFTAEALRRCRLTVQVSTKLNRAHLVTGREALILPCLGRTEVDLQASGRQFVTVENSMGIVHTSRGFLPPASEHLLSEPALVARLARAVLGAASPQPWEAWAGDYNRIREEIEAVIPGFTDYNRRVREPDGFYLPNGPRSGVFKTDTGRAMFTVHTIPRSALPEGQYLMMTIRSHDQYNTTIYGLDDRYRGIKGARRVVMMNPEDMADAGLKERDVVDLTSHFHGETRRAEAFQVVPFAIPRRCVATYFPEANVLVPIGSTADGSNTPASKSVVVSLAFARNTVIGQ